MWALQRMVGMDRNLLVCCEVDGGVEPQPGSVEPSLPWLSHGWRTAPFPMSQVQACISAVVMYLEASVQSHISDLSKQLGQCFVTLS